jgi:hypothetical protein
MASNPFLRPLAYVPPSTQPSPFATAAQATLGAVGTALQPLGVPQQLLFGVVGELQGQRGSLLRSVKASAGMLTYGAAEYLPGMDGSREQSVTGGQLARGFGLTGTAANVAGTAADFLLDPANLFAGAGAVAKVGGASKLATKFNRAADVLGGAAAFTSFKQELGFIGRSTGPVERQSLRNLASELTARGATQEQRNLIFAVVDDRAKRYATVTGTSRDDYFTTQLPKQLVGSSAPDEVAEGRGLLEFPFGTEPKIKGRQMAKPEPGGRNKGLGTNSLPQDYDEGQKRLTKFLKVIKGEVHELDEHGLPKSPDFQGGQAKWLVKRNSKNQEVGRVRVGSMKYEEWKDEFMRRQSLFTPEQQESVRYWYERLPEMFDRFVGKGYSFNDVETGEAIKLDSWNDLLAWLISQQNISPSGGMGNVLRALDKLRYGQDTVREFRRIDAKEMKELAKAAQPGETVPRFKLWKGIAGSDTRNEAAIQAVLRGRVPLKGGQGVKLVDFVDSMLLSPTRTYMLNDPRAGKPPGAIDVWAARGGGYVDKSFVKNLVEEKNWSIENADGSFTPVTHESLIADGDGVSDIIYDVATARYQRLAEELGWEPWQVQAADWMALQKASGGNMESPFEIFSGNWKTIATELSFGAESPLSKKYPGFDNLAYAPKADLTLRVVQDVVGEIENKLNVKASRINLVAGGYDWDGEIQQNPSVAIELFASEEEAMQAATTIGFALQQTDILMHVPKVSGTTQALRILEAPGSAVSLRDPAVMKEFVQKLRDRDEAFALGYQGFERDGAGGIRFIDWAPQPYTPDVEKAVAKDGLDTALGMYERSATIPNRGTQQMRFFGTRTSNVVAEVAEEMGIELHSDDPFIIMGVDLTNFRNEWGQSRNGEAYQLAGSGNRGRPSLSGADYDHLKLVVEQAIERHARALDDQQPGIWDTLLGRSRPDDGPPAAVSGPPALPWKEDSAALPGVAFGSPLGTLRAGVSLARRADQAQQEQEEPLKVPPAQAYNALAVLTSELAKRRDEPDQSFQAWAKQFAPTLAKALGITPEQAWEFIREADSKSR